MRKLFDESATKQQLLEEIAYLESRLAHVENDQARSAAPEDITIALENAKQEVTQFISVASHDMREPLRLISSYLGLLQVEFGDDINPTAEKYIQIVIENANRMQTLIESLLEYSKVGQQITFQRVNLKHVVQHCIFNLRLKIDESQAEITVDDLPQIITSESHMMQLFQNLLENAIKFRGDRTPQIHISAVNNHDHWLFHIQDNGIGIPTKYADQIFTMFQRLHSNQEYPGTGIGLTLCQRIVEQYGGKIWVESVEGEGSTFYWTLPIIN